MEPVWIGVDVGGTKVLAGVVDEPGASLRTARRATPGRRVDIAHVEDALEAAVLEAADGAPIAGVGVAAAGFVDAAGERVMFAPHLPWQGEDVRDRLGRAVGRAGDAGQRRQLRGPRRVDVRRSARRRGRRSSSPWAPASAARILIDGQLVRGANGMAGEFGHMQVVPDGQPCECGGQGLLGAVLLGQRARPLRPASGWGSSPRCWRRRPAATPTW